jgi:energy-coupling factor transporter ATP-binding protein EcfA2
VGESIVIRKIAIRNYRMFREFDLEFSPGINILVGRNDTGKSTLMEAINLALTGRVQGRALAQELSPYHINLDATREYVQKLRSGGEAVLPTMIIDLFLDDADQAEILRGTNNIYGEDACGVRIQAKFSQDFCEEYSSFIQKPGAVRLAPTEYYKVDWLGFSGNAVSARSLPKTASVIDPTTIRLQSGVDYHLQEIIRTHLDPKDRVELSRQYRTLREEFSDKEAVKAINERLQTDDDDLTDRKLSLAIDISQRYTWESSLIAHLDDLPLQLIGKGDQNALKTLLAIGRRADNAKVVLIEEPETHLSHSSLRKLLHRVEDRCAGKQLVIATHSNYVLNKLGLDNLILLGDGAATRITDMPAGTVDYFKKLAGFDTLRLVLAEGAILVEGPSDELVIQRGYKDAKGKLPIDDGIDVISVGLSHKRFLDLAIRLNRRVWVVTDNDHKALEQVKERFSGYLDSDVVSLHVGSDPALNTLEPQIVAANNLETLNAALGTQCSSKEKVLEGMLQDKTGAALSIFESETKIEMPEYIRSVFTE